MPEPPYKLAKLIESEKHRWYIVFYVWDAVQGKIVRKRDYDVSKLSTRSEKLKFAEKRIREINKLLINGFHIHAEKHSKENASIINPRKEYSVSEAFKTVMLFVKASKRIDTYNSYASVKKLFIEYCTLQRWEKWPIKSLTKQDIISFLDYSQAAHGIANITRNKYCGFIRAMLGMMVERKMIEFNPASGIKKEPEEIGKNIAYSPEHVKIIKKELEAKNIHLWHFVQFMFYGFIRPAELARLKVSMIDLKNKVIILPPGITKNRKIRHVRLSPNFLEVIKSMNLNFKYSDHYVFGHNLLPGKIKLQKNYAGAQHAKIVKANDFGTDYTLYSWKHTGVVNHYRAGVDIKSLQQQLGHSSLEETNIYLKSLGLLADLSAFDKAPSINM